MPAGRQAWQMRNANHESRHRAMEEIRQKHLSLRECRTATGITTSESRHLANQRLKM